MDMVAREAAKMKFLQGEVRVGDLFVDAGACYGLFTFPIAKLVGSGGRVLAFEPNSTNATRLTIDVTEKRCRNIFVSTCALSNYTGHGKLYLGKSNALHSLKPGLPGRYDACEKVTVARLDGYMSAAYDEWQISGCKIDVEGSELEVLQGATKALQTMRYLAMDVHPSLGVDVDEIEHLLIDAGFQLIRMQGMHNEIFAIRK